MVCLAGVECYSDSWLGEDNSLKLRSAGVSLRAGSVVAAMFGERELDVSISPCEVSRFVSGVPVSSFSLVTSSWIFLTFTSYSGKRVAQCWHVYFLFVFVNSTSIYTGSNVHE